MEIATRIPQSALELYPGPVTPLSFVIEIIGRRKVFNCEPHDLKSVISSFDDRPECLPITTAPISARMWSEPMAPSRSANR